MRSTEPAPRRDRRRRVWNVPAMAFCVLAACLSHVARAQVDEDELGAWYTYAWSTRLEERSLGFQGDVQYRNWDGLGDLEQLLIRGGVTLSPQGGRATYTFGAAHITSGAYGSSSATTAERRVYQEALLPAQIGRKVFLTHRFRFEQRWVDGQDFRTRLRYFFGLNVPFNQDTLGDGALYLSFYNELFVNLERGIGGGRRVEHFDRNRAYLALGYSISDDLRLQLGYLFQETETVDKGQLQVNFLHRF
jgi:hypothetical protein